MRQRYLSCIGLQRVADRHRFILRYGSPAFFRISLTLYSRVQTGATDLFQASIVLCSDSMCATRQIQSRTLHVAKLTANGGRPNCQKGPMTGDGRNERQSSGFWCLRNVMVARARFGVTVWYVIEYLKAETRTTQTTLTSTSQNRLSAAVEVIVERHHDLLTIKCREIESLQK